MLMQELKTMVPLIHYLKNNNVSLKCMCLFASLCEFYSLKRIMVDIRLCLKVIPQKKKLSNNFLKLFLNFP